MGISLGIDYANQQWRTCLMEGGQVLECRSFPDTQVLLAYLAQTCGRFPEPAIALASHLHVPLSPLTLLVEDVAPRAEAEPAADAAFWNALLTLNTINFRSYVLPGLDYLDSIPFHRKLYRGPLGGAARLCRIATLLYRLRQRQTCWPSMCFLYLEVGSYASSISVVQEGRLIDATAPKAFEVTPYNEGEPHEQIMSLAFWEMLTQDLAALLALHHYEDVVLAFDELFPPCARQQEELIKRFGDLYQLYLSPRSESAPGAFDAAIGAAILAEGLFHSGLAAEVVERLLSPLAQS